MKNVLAAYKNGYMDGMDFSLIVLMEKHRWTRERVLAFYREMAELHDEFGKVYSEDTKDKEYAQTVLDRKLEALAGDLFVPWEERYE
jgi:hypothetical protein